MSYITVVCVQGIPILSPLLFMPSLYSTLKFEEFLIYCIVRNDDVSFIRSKRVNEEIILRYTSSRKTSSHAKFQAQCLHGLPVLT